MGKFCLEYFNFYQFHRRRYHLTIEGAKPSHASKWLHYDNWWDLSWSSFGRWAKELWCYSELSKMLRYGRSNWDHVAIVSTQCLSQVTQSFKGQHFQGQLAFLSFHLKVNKEAAWTLSNIRRHSESNWSNPSPNEGHYWSRWFGTIGAHKTLVYQRYGVRYEKVFLFYYFTILKAYVWAYWLGGVTKVKYGVSRIPYQGNHE